MILWIPPLTKDCDKVFFVPSKGTFIVKYSKLKI